MKSDEATSDLSVCSLSGSSWCVTASRTSPVLYRRSFVLPIGDLDSASITGQCVYRINPHQYTLRNFLIRTPGVHVDPSGISSFMMQVPGMLSQKWFSYLRQDALLSIVFIGWLVCWCVSVGVFVSVFVCSLTCFWAEYLENGWS